MSQALVSARQALMTRDRVMMAIISAVEAQRPLRPLSRQRPDFFTTVVRTIADQQLSVKAAATIWQRVVAAHGEPQPHTWQQLLPQDLRSCGLSLAKSRNIIANAALFASGYVLPSAIQLRRMTDEELERHLVQLPGIGPWSAQMLMIFALRRPNVWSPADAGLRRAVCQWYHLDPADYAARHGQLAQTWQPHCSLACRYLWASLNLAPGNHQQVSA